MRRRIALVSIGMIVLTLCGCLPRRMFWSPDGQRAAIIGKDGLRLCDVNGKLTEPVAKDVELVAWLPDSRHLLAVREVQVDNWEEASAVLTPERREAILKLAEPLRAEVLAYDKRIGPFDWANFKPRVAREMTEGEMAALVLYVREHRPEGLREVMGESKWKDVQTARPTVYLVQVYEAGETGATEGQVILRTLDKLGEVRPSRDGKVVACVQKAIGESQRLIVLPATGGEPWTVAEPVAMFPDWSADDRSLVYATVSARVLADSEALQLGSVTQRRVRDDSGTLLGDFGKPEEGVGVLYWPEMKVRCLRDGRILFAGAEVSLPATKDDMPQKLTLFAIDPGRPTVVRLVTRAAEAKMPEGISQAIWELSPDEKRVAIGGDGNAAVYVLATGELQWAVTETGWKPGGMPAWRTAEELAVFVPPGHKMGSKDRQEIALWAAGVKGDCLSCGWPAIIEEQQPDNSKVSNPATQPASASAE